MLSKGQHIYLAYGSNLHPRRLEARIGPARLLGTVTLPGWSLRFDKRGGDGSAKANLHAAPARDLIAQAAAYAVRLDQLRTLDVFEGCGRGYETFPITVRLDDQVVDAFTYLAPSQWLSSSLLPFDWYVDLIVSGARFHEFDESYVKWIARHDTDRDPEFGRARGELEAMHLPIHAHYER